MKKLLLALLFCFSVVLAQAGVVSTTTEYLPGSVTQLDGASTTYVAPNAVINLTRRLDLGTPIAATAANIVTSTNCKVGAYPIAAQPDVARVLVVTATASGTGGTATPGIVSIAGTDINGYVISEVITPVYGSSVSGSNAFAHVSAIVGSGWVSSGTSNTITVGVSNKLGLPACTVETTELAISGTAVGLAAVTSGSAVPFATSVVDASGVAAYTGSAKVSVFLNGLTVAPQANTSNVPQSNY